jgi:hypothetical protein
LVVRDDRPGNDELWDLVRLLRPGAALPTKEERAEAERQRPFIYPESITMDNGLDFRGTTFEAACAKFKVNMVLARPYTPIDKPEVERVFLTIKHGFCANQPGYVGGDVGERGLKPELEPLLSLPVAAELFDQWVCMVYQNEPHEGLRDPMSPNIKFSPNQMYQASVNLSGQMRLPLTEDDYIGLLPSRYCTITHEGVQVNYRKYNSIDLQFLRRLPSDQKSMKHKWEVRFNPYNPRLVWVRDADYGWIECVWRDDDTFRQPFAPAILREARHIKVASEAAGEPAKVQEIARLLTLSTAARASSKKQDVRNRTALARAAAEGTPMPESKSHPVVDEVGTLDEPAVEVLPTVHLGRLRR